MAGPALLDDCPHGGYELEYGIDSNLNNVLDDGEVNGKESICDGAPGAKGDPGEKGAAGEKGATGSTGDPGEKGSVGADGTPGLNALVVTADEPAGGTCPGGGVRVNSGVDTNSDGALDAGEVNHTHTVCHGATGDKGDDGLNGTDGKDGDKGEKGDTGLKGADGKDGEKGDPGDPFASKDGAEVAAIQVKATEPSSIIQGTMWYDTSTGTLKINTAVTGDPAVWVGFGAGAPWDVYSAPEPIAFHLNKGGTDQPSAGKNTKVQWENIVFATHSGSVDASGFTAPDYGTYYFYANVQYSQIALYDNYIAIRKNGQDVAITNYFISYDDGFNTGAPGMTVATTLQLEPGDQIDVLVQEESGDPLPINGHTSFTYFTGWRLY